MKPTLSLTEGSIRRRLFVFMIPILVGNVLQSLNAAVNSVWIGRYLGEAALTASSNANMVYYLLMGALSSGLLLFGIVDVAGALWTSHGLRKPA